MALTRLDMLDVMGNAEMLAPIFVEIDGQQLPIMQADSYADRIVLRVKHDIVKKPAPSDADIRENERIERRMGRHTP